jgi:DNA-binding CsgD family transcriptional regulator
MIGAIIENSLLSELHFDYAAMLSVRSEGDSVMLYANLPPTSISALYIKAISRLGSDLRHSSMMSNESTQFLVALQDLYSPVSTQIGKVLNSQLRPIRAGALGYGFGVLDARMTLVYVLARADDQPAFSEHDIQSMRRHAAAVWGALRDCIRIAALLEPTRDLNPSMKDHKPLAASGFSDFEAPLDCEIQSFAKSFGVKFSQREIPVTSYSLQGESNKIIASRLGISPHTVSIHLRNIYRKINVTSRRQLSATYLAFIKPSTGLSGIASLILL